MMVTTTPLVYRLTHCEKLAPLQERRQAREAASPVFYVIFLL
jgi:hypothetical protein